MVRTPTGWAGPGLVPPVSLNGDLGSAKKVVQLPQARRWSGRFDAPIIQPSRGVLWRGEQCNKIAPSYPAVRAAHGYSGPWPHAPDSCKKGNEREGTCVVWGNGRVLRALFTVRLYRPPPRLLHPFGCLYGRNSDPSGSLLLKGYPAGMNN